MYRNLDVFIDSASWNSKLVPTELSTRVGNSQANILGALLFTALWTRPPRVYGFHLSDLWAWYRYFPAIAEASELRLRQEWTSVDPHQKTILSDELGIGFTTQLIQDALHCGEFADTLYVVNALEPDRFVLTDSSKTGSQKSPDYIARLQGASYLVLECKGTQSSRAALRRAITRGTAQKKNLKASTPASIRHSLVAGLFIPQWSNPEWPCIWVSDPAWEELESLISRQPKGRVDEAITQVTLAKQLALAGLSEFPEYLVASRTGELAGFPERIQREIGDLLGESYRIVFDSADIPSRERVLETTPRVMLSVQPSPDLLDRLNRPTSVSEIVSGLSRLDPARWRISTGEFFAEVMTPIGFHFKLEVEPRIPNRKRATAATV